MTRVGYAFVALALAQAILMKIFGLDQAGWLTSFGICFVIGTILLVVGGSKRIATGEVKLRPVQALKLMPVYFLIMASVMLGFDLLFEASDKSLSERLILVSVMSVFFSFYTSAHSTAQ